MRIRINALNASQMGESIVVNMIIPSVFKNAIQSILDTFTRGIEYDIKPYKQKRSLSANAYAWVLMDKLADKLRTTKEEIYRHIIDQVGVFEEIKVNSPEAGQRFKRIWQRNGLGWLTKTIDDTTILAYYGSSTYDTKQMARLIDYLQAECVNQGIEIRPVWEVEAMLKEWR